MKTFVSTGTVTIPAFVDLSKNLFVGLDGNICGAGKMALGVCQADTAQGNMAPVDISGILVVLSGGVVAAGAAVESDAAGKAVASSNVAVATAQTAGAVPVTADAATATLTSTVTGGVLPKIVNGYALDAATGANQAIRILR